MKVAYLFNTVRRGQYERIESGEYNDNHFYSLFRLRKLGIKADFLEIESYFPARAARFLRRRVLSIYTVHLPLAWKIFSYDVVFHINAFACQLVWILLGLKKPVWVMYDFSIMGFLGHEKSLKQKLFRFIVGRTGGIITVSRKEAELLERRFPHLSPRIRFIYHGADTVFFAPKPAEQKHQVLTVGLDPGRDYQTLFAATGPDMPVVATRSHRTKALQGPLPAHVRVESFTDHELREEYAASKIIAIPLNIEGGQNDAMGLSTLMEAMAMGKAIVATRTFTMESYITDGANGLLVEQGDTEGMRTALAKLLSDDALRATLGANARAFIEEHCEADKVAADMAKFFYELSGALPEKQGVLG